MEKNIEEAKKWLRKAAEAGSQEAKEKLELLILNRHIFRLNKSEIKVGDIVTLGNYPQNSKDKKEPIEWRVLAKGGKALVISQYALDCKKYNEKRESTSWEKCTLRKWLNSDFLNSAFDYTEQNLIQLSAVTADKNPEYITNQGNGTKDKVFLLSAMEVELYFKNDEDRKCNPTKFAINNGASKDYSGQCWWWLRSLGGNNSRSATNVRLDGSVDFYGDLVYDFFYSVRPALWINLKS